MMIREACRAGTFYAADPKECREDVIQCLQDAGQGADLPEVIHGGIVPHAGWIYSGSTAATTFAAIAARRSPATVVIFGAVHRPMRSDAAVFSRGAWETPLGTVAIDERFAERLLGATALVQDEPHAHEAEHSIEVQVPFVQHCFPKARIVPVMVMPDLNAVEIGRAAARIAKDSGTDAVFVGSTDLTHYGPSYGVTAHGIGPEGLRWAKDLNDRRMIDQILALDAKGVVAESQMHHNACGGGAIAACIAACCEMGATEARLLRHTSSAESAVEARYRTKTDSVGYASIVFGGPA